MQRRALGDTSLTGPHPPINLFHCFTTREVTIHTIGISLDDVVAPELDEYHFLRELRRVPDLYERGDSIAHQHLAGADCIAHFFSGQGVSTGAKYLCPR